MMRLGLIAFAGLLVSATAGAQQRPADHEFDRILSSVLDYHSRSVGRYGRGTCVARETSSPLRASALFVFAFVDEDPSRPASSDYPGAWRTPVQPDGVRTSNSLHAVELNRLLLVARESLSSEDITEIPGAIVPRRFRLVSSPSLCRHFPSIRLSTPVIVGDVAFVEDVGRYGATLIALRRNDAGWAVIAWTGLYVV